jgi:hypothetical protein
MRCPVKVTRGGRTVCAMSVRSLAYRIILLAGFAIGFVGAVAYDVLY